MTLQELSQKCYENAEQKDFYDDYRRVMARLAEHPDDAKFVHQIWLSHRLMLIVSELAEALEAVRDGNMSGDPKSGGFVEELVDTNIRLADLLKYIAILLGLPPDEVESAIKGKMAYNASRPHKHNRSL